MLDRLIDTVYWMVNGLVDYVINQSSITFKGKTTNASKMHFRKFFFIQKSESDLSPAPLAVVVEAVEPDGQRSSPGIGFLATVVYPGALRVFSYKKIRTCRVKEKKK